MDSFGSRVRSALSERGLSLRAASRAMHYDVSYLSRVVKGQQSPSLKMAHALDELLCTGGEFAALPGPPSSSSDIIETARALAAPLLAHDNRFGGDHVASAAVQLWKAEARTMNGEHKEQLSAVSELAEVAGWILFDANRQTEARQALTEAHLFARLAGDNPLEWFILDLMAMHGIQTGRVGESLHISDELLTVSRIPGRVALMSHVRRALGLAQAGDRTRALEAAERASGGLQDSVGDRDPQWTWWIDEGEVSRHHGEVYMSLGDPQSALPHLHRATELERTGGRRELGHACAELEALATIGAWRDCEVVITERLPRLQHVTSSRIRARLKAVVRTLDRNAPTWLSDVAHDVA